LYSKKLNSRKIGTFRQQEETTLEFACHLFGIDRQVLYRMYVHGSLKKTKQSKLNIPMKLVLRQFW
jgi:putative transposase